MGSYTGEWNAVACALLAMALLTLSGPVDLNLSRIGYLFVAFIVLIMGQWAFGMVAYAQLATLGALYLLFAVAMTLTAQTLCNRLGVEMVVHFMAMAMLVAAAASALFGYLQALGIPNAFTLPLLNPRVYGNTGQATHYATVLGLGVAAACTLRSWPATCAWLLWLIPAMLLSGSRSALLYIAIVAGAYLWQKPARLRQVLQFGLVALLLAIVVVGMKPVVVEMLARPMSGPSPRLHLWSEALHMMAQHPIAGVGYKGFAAANFMNDNPFGDQTIADNAHNLFLNVGAEFGVMGLSVLCLGLFAWAARVMVPQPAVKWFPFVVLAIFGAHSLLEYPIYYTYFLGPIAFAFGITEWDREEAWS